MSLDSPIDVVCQGSSREMGRAQGAALVAKIRAAKRALFELEAFRLKQPRWLPFSAFLWLAEHRARRVMGSRLAREQADMHQRLVGLAEGSGVSLRALYLLNALEALLSTVKGSVVGPSLGACSAIAVRGSRSATGEIVVTRNFDYLPLVQPFYCLRDSRPTGGHRALEFTVAPLAGAVDGINEQGLTITYNYAFTIDADRAVTPITMAIARALAVCTSVTEAADLIAAQPRWGGAILMLADAAGDMASLELSNSKSRLRRPEPGEDFIFHTNAFNHSEMCQVQVPSEAIFSEQSPQPLRGRRVLESAEIRSSRLASLIAKRGSLDADELLDVMADHGESGDGGEHTLCTHSEYWNTTASLQYFPASRRLRVAYDATCQAQYRSAAL